MKTIYSSSLLNPMRYEYQIETMLEARKLPVGVVNTQSHAIGINGGEPIIVAMDCMIRLAKARKASDMGPICCDYILCPIFIQTIKGLRAMLSFDGAIAIEEGITTDTKDNGAVEAMFWEAVKLAGLTESDLGL